MLENKIYFITNYSDVEELNFTIYYSDAEKFNMSVKLFKYSIDTLNLKDIHSIYFNIPNCIKNEQFYDTIKLDIPYGVTNVYASSTKLNKLKIPESIEFVKFHLETLIVIPDNINKNARFITYL